MFKTVATRHLAQSNLYRNKVILDFSHPSILPNKTQEKNKMFASKCDYISNVSIPTLKWAKNIVNTTFQPATTTHATRGMSQSLQQISAKFGHTWPSPNCACQFSVFQHECPIMFTFKSVKSYRAERRKETGIKTRHVRHKCFTMSVSCTICFKTLTISRIKIVMKNEAHILSCTVNWN